MSLSYYLLSSHPPPPFFFADSSQDATKEAIHRSIYNLQHNLADLLPIWENFIRGKVYFNLATKTYVRECLENWDPTFKTVDLASCGWFKRYPFNQLRRKMEFGNAETRKAEM